MKWLDVLLGRKPREEASTDAVINDLRVSAQKVHRRTERLEAELRRVNEQLQKAANER